MTERQTTELVRGGERRLEVQVGPIAGVDVRPSRVFFWYGDVRDGSERIISLDNVPRQLRGSRPRRTVRLPGVELSYVGNPLVTVALASRAWYRELRRYATGDGRS